MKVTDGKTPPHPGTIQWVDGATGAITQEEPALRVPEGLRYGRDAAGTLVPVVRIVVHAEPERRVARAYSEAGELLHSTTHLFGV